MNLPLLTTKLRVPRVQGSLVSRPRLTRRLDEGLERRLTLISAPAGSGKTTLLAQWLAGCGSDVRAAWLSLDEGDNDPARFLTYVAAAFRGIAPQVSQELPGFRLTPRPSDLKEPLALLLDDLGSAQGTIVLVLDDYHVISARPVHDGVSFLLDYLPENVHLVMATRADPPFPVARLRGRGQLLELDFADLRFLTGETDQFLNEVLGLHVSSADVAELENRLEGWIAGLQMAALSLKQQDDVSGFIRAMAASDRFILDYLMEEILGRQPEAIQTFLLETTILDRLCGPLCDAVTGRADSQSLLEQMAHANLVIMAHDGEPYWYRYHHVLADLLRNRLQLTRPRAVPQLHLRAADWFEQAGLAGPAIRHALAAADFPRAAALIESSAEAAILRSEVETLLTWIEALPEDLLRSRPLLCIYHAVTLLVNDRPLSKIEARLQEAERAAAASGDWVAVLRAVLAILAGDLRGVDLGQKVLELLPPGSAVLRSLLTCMLGIAHLAHGETGQARTELEEAVALSRQSGNTLTAVIALCHLAELSMLEGRLHEAHARYKEAGKLATTENPDRPLPAAGLPLIGVGNLLCEWNHLDEAVATLTRGIGLVKRWFKLQAMEGYIALARVQQAQGNAGNAERSLQTVFDLSERLTEPEALALACHQANLWIAQGNLPGVVRWIRDRGFDEDHSQNQGRPRSGYYTIRELELTTLARAQIALGRSGDALLLLQQLLQEAERRRHGGSIIRILILQALALHKSGDAAGGLRSLERALVIAEPEEYIRVFADHGDALAGLLRQAEARGMTPHYVRRIRNAMGRPSAPLAHGPLPQRPTQPLPEPLSDREMEVLRLLRTHLSSTEIAGQIYVAASTVRSHMKSIYAKLNAHSRTEAVQRAKELGLL